MPTGQDLINIPHLALSDTFRTWYARTNNIIDALNPLQVYDVQSGITGTGISVTGVGQSGGIAFVSANVGAGIGIGSGTGQTYGNRIVIDFSGLTPSALTLTANPATDDYYIVNDSSDTTLNAAGTPKRIRASKILPTTVDMDSPLTISASSVTISGSLIVQGAQTFLNTNNLQVEDFQLEIAYQQAGFLGLTGVTTGSWASFANRIGATAFYAPPGGTANLANATVIGYLKSVTGPYGGPTAMMKIGSVFERGSPQLFTVTGGSVVISGITGGTFAVAAVNGLGPFGVFGPTTDFASDAALNQAGLVVKGLSSDKSFLWYDTVDAFLVNQNLGVASPTAFIYGGRFNNTVVAGVTPFEFSTEPGEQNTINIKSFAGATNDYWSVDFVDTDAKYLNLRAISSTASFHIAQFHRGGTGQSFPTVPITNKAFYLNSDLLDGAHGYTGATAYGIPIANADGELDTEWVKPTRIVKKFTQSGHGFVVGTVIRYDSGTNTYQRAYCDNSIAAETIGVVEKVNGNDFWVNMQGHIRGLSLSATGTVYFLAQQGASGGLITNPTTLNSTDVRKAILYSISTSEAMVLGHPGVKLADPTDLLYTNNLVPVGTLQPYGGFPSASLSSQGWTVCDGRRLYARDYEDLHGAIGQNFYADGTVVSANGSPLTIAFSGGDTLGFAGGTGGTGETVVVSVGGTGSFFGRKFTPIAAGATTVTVDGLTTGAFGTTSGDRVKVYGQDIGIDTVFLIPDMRRRVPVGASVGTGVGGSATPSRPLGEVSGIGGATGSTGDFLTTVNYMIRTKNRFDAVVITGHNHDARYIRFDATHGMTWGSPSDLTLANRNQFRSNARVLGDGTDGSDTFYASLEVSTATGHSSSPSITPNEYAAFYGSSALKVQGSSMTGSSISILNNNGDDYEGQISARINFFAVGTTGTYAPALYGSSIGMSIRSGTGNTDELGLSLAGKTEYRWGVNLPAYSATGGFSDRTAFIITKRSDSGPTGPNVAIIKNIPYGGQPVVPGSATTTPTQGYRLYITADGQIIRGSTLETII